MLTITPSWRHCGTIFFVQDVGTSIVPFSALRGGPALGQKEREREKTKRQVAKRQRAFGVQVDVDVLFILFLGGGLNDTKDGADSSIIMFFDNIL